MRKFLPLVSLLEVFKQHKEPPVQYEVFHLTINPFWYYVWWVLCMKVYLSANFPNAFLYCHILSKVEMHLKLVWLLCFAGSIFSKLANSFCKCNANHYTATFYQRQHDPGNLKIAMFDVVANHSIVISWDLLRGQAPQKWPQYLICFHEFRCFGLHNGLSGVASSCRRCIAPCDKFWPRDKEIQIHLKQLKVFSLPNENSVWGGEWFHWKFGIFAIQTLMTLVLSPLADQAFQQLFLFIF